MCTFQSRCCSICMPRYFTLLEILIFWPLIRKLRYLIICFQLDLSIIISVLSALKLILFDLSHWTVREIMIYMFVDFFHRLLEYRRFVSYAKCSIWLCLTDLHRSLTKMINSGPNTDPCGTPWVTKLDSESKPLTDVYWTLWDKNDWNQSTARLLIP